jgi:hypothetical protein
VLVACEAAHADTVLARARQAGLPARTIGRTGGSTIRIAVDGVEALKVDVPEAEQIWATAIASRMAKPAVAGAA